MINKRVRKLLQRAILIMAPLFFIACEKSTGEIGLGQVVDSKGVLGTKKNMPFVTYNASYDSINTTGAAVQIAGTYQDPATGLVEAKFQTHLLLSLLSPDFGDQPICDSVVMFLAYAGYYADTATPTTFVINELGEVMNPDSTYYSNKEFVLGQELGRITQIPTPNTPNTDEGSTVSPSLKLYLDKAYFQDKLIDASRIAQQYFTSNEDFIKHINGLQISVENTTDGLTYFNVGSLASLVRVYYREKPQDTIAKQYELYYGASATSGYTTVNSYKHNHSMGGPDLDNQDTINGEPTLVAQAMAGVVTHVQLPQSLKELKDSNWALNRAELVFSVREGSGGKYTLPSALLILENKPEGRGAIDDYRAVPDPNNPQSPGVSGVPVDGRLERGFLRDRTYTFNITRIVHRYINTTDTIYPLVLIPEFAASQAWRTVLNGNNDPVKPAQFNIYYTKTRN